MKTASKILTFLTLALIMGAASQARADEWMGYQAQEDFPVQKEIESRQIHTVHSLRNWQCATVPAAQETVAPAILFPTATDTLSPEAKASVHKVATILKSPAYHGRHVLVSGYTDNRGNSATNQRLSYHRATMVVKQLVKEGVPAGQLTAQGFGAENPAATNATPEGRALNRRVTFTLAHHQMN